MKISLNWLKDYIDLKGISIREIVDRLTVSGLEVEEVVDQSKKFEKIVVGFVKEVKRHPNADKLSVCIVSDGKEEFNVVCGAHNVAAGQKVPFAKVSAVIPKNGLILSQVKIRGEISNGMICSEDELELGDDHTGIMVLDSKLKIGQSFAKAIGLDDVVLEVAITPNRADALSHIGVARDLSAIFNRPLRLPEIKIKEIKTYSRDLAKIKIEDKNGCPRYIGKVVTDVKVQESPEWLKKKLESIGLRPINNVVDVTNFVLYEIGQPLHAFDLNFLSGKKIIVRSAGEDDKFVSLDSKERKLESDDLMICDSVKPVAIAGVMGGENSEVKLETKNILIESAFFAPSRIRKTSKRLGLSTDASYRFERGTDPEKTKWAARRAAQLIQESAGGFIAKSEIDEYPKPIIKKKVSLRFSRITKVLGYKISSTIVKGILIKLGFEINIAKGGILTVLVPTYRHDIEREIDLIEEVARIYGYNKIPVVTKISINLEEKVDNSEFDDKVREILNSFGFYEIVTNSFLTEATASRFGKPIKMLNPQNSEMSHLRTSLIPGMLTSISNNLKVSEKDLQLFEIGKVFELKNDGIKDFNDFQESEQIIISMTGNSIRSEWFEKDKLFDIYDVIGVAESFFEKLFPNIKVQFKFEPSNSEFFDCHFEILSIDQMIGLGGKLRQDICSLFDVGQNVFVLQFDLDKLKIIGRPQNTFNGLLKFPKVYRDVAFVLDNQITSGQVIKTIKDATTNLLHNIKLFDIFQSESLGRSKKSLAFQLEFFDLSRTLTEEEVEKDFRNAIYAVVEKFSAQLRGS